MDAFLYPASEDSFLSVVTGLGSGEVEGCFCVVIFGQIKEHLIKEAISPCAPQQRDPNFFIKLRS